MQTPRYRFDRFELHPTERRLLVEGQPAVLGARALDVLMALVERRGRVVGKDELLEVAWPGLVVEENNLAVQISTLRKLLGSRVIATVAGRGYQFAGDLVDATAAPAAPTGPARPTLIAREAELDTLAALLAEHRLVTLVGAGGIGKTSLAEAWRRERSGSQPVSWVELATLANADPGTAPQARPSQEALQKAVATALGVSPGELPSALAAQPRTLVLDNAEPLADAVAHWAQAALAAAPALRLLVTSQVPLRLQAERVCRIGALPLPDDRVSPLQALGFGSVALFVERATAADPQFALTQDNVATVAEICRRLDGVPLALELAAARVGALGLNALAAALDERFRVLGGGSRAAPARQRTLRAALEWSYGLLDPDAQALLRCLGSFASAFTLQDAQQAAGAAAPPIDTWAVLAALGALVENSLVNIEPGDPPLYQLPESTRMFALDQQRDRGVAPAAAPPPAAANESTRRLLGGLGADGGAGDIEHGTVIALAQRFRPDEVRDFDAAVKELERAVEIASRVVTTSGDEASDAFVGDVLASLAEQTRSGDFDAGTDAVDEALAELERREARQRAAWRRSRRALLEAGVQQDLLRRDAFAVARRIESLVGLDAAERPSWAATYLEHEDHYLAEGADQGIQLSLAVAIELLRRRLAAAVRPEERREAGRRLAQALAMLGERETGDDAAREAVQVCRAALADADRAAAPGEWAALQHELGSALRSLGDRLGDQALLQEAVDCCRLALQERPRSQAPLDWAASQHVLGNALRCLGAREAGTTRLADAARALREALNERTRARAPLDWARTQNILAVTLSLWARRETGTARHHEAVAALRETLKELTRETAPLDWARLQNTLGIELATIGEIEQDAATLRAAVAAYRDALSVSTFDRAPQVWGLLQHNLGGALRALGDRDNDTRCLHEAIQAFQAALTQHTRERFPLHWAAGKNDLGLALRSLGERQAGRAGEDTLEEAVAVLREALAVRARDAVPMDWATTQSDLALALVTLGERRGDRAAVEGALQCAEQALEVLTRDAAPAQRAEVQAHLERARAWLLKAGAKPQRRAG